MTPTTETRLVLVVRRTRLDELIARFNTEAQARFYVEHLGADFSDYKTEDEIYRQQASAAQTLLSGIGRLHTIERSFVPNYVFGPQDVVVALGQDGLVANVLKYLPTQPLLGVNPDPKRWEGVLLPFTVSALSAVLPEVIRNARQIREVFDDVPQIDPAPEGDRAEDHSSSGIIVSTGVGSTGWLRSVIAGATGIVREISHASGKVATERRIPWEAKQLVFSVREPWPSKTSAARITFGDITEKRPLQLLSLMPERGVIFSDGIEEDYLEFNAGTRAVITIAERRGHLVV